MVFDGTDPAERRNSDGHRHVDVTARPHAIFRQVTDDLVERRGGEPVELDLRYWYEAADRHADGDADDRRLREWGVETPLLAEGFGQALGDAEDTAERGHVLPEDQHALVGGHRVVQRPVDRLRHRQSRGSPSKLWAQRDRGQ